MLCKNCSDVDIVAALCGKYEGEDAGVWISRTSDPDLVWLWVEEKGCELCEFLCFVSKNFKPERRFVDIDNVRPGRLKVHRHTQASDPSILADWTSIKVMFNVPNEPSKSLYWFSSSHEFAFGPQETIGMTDFESTVRLLPMKADLSTFRDILRTCIQNHNRCRLSISETMTRPSHLRVIDCSSYNVILAPKDVQYAALSYQWGNKSSTFDLATNKKLPTLLPATIKDSIAATLSLGLQYLWVDAYCILQNDEEDFKNQIRQMDLIYQFASITIFAVTGTSSDSGLSGLSYTGSRFQADSMFRGFRLLTFSTKTTQSIQVSGWHSRAWTFQESFFSRRRLFFAEDQILFDCEEGTAAESHTHCRKGPILSKWHLDMSDLRIYVLIQEFSNRHLTFPADILNAFEGVLNSFRNQQPGFKTYWGIPMSLAYVHESSNCSANFLLGLSWGSIGQTGELYRRAGFPSWSWAGWIGPINYQLVYITSEIELEGCSEWKVDKESDDHSEKSWRETECNTSTHCQEMKTSQRLRISGPSLRVILRKVKYGASFGINVSLSLNQSSECRVCSLNLNGRFDELDMLHGSSDTDTRTCFAICLYSYNKLICHAGEKVLLLVSRRRSHWERVGICVAPFETKEEASSFEDQLRATPSFQTRDFCIQ